MTILSSRLKEALKNAKMSQADLAAATGIGKSSISTYLSGAYLPKQQNVSKMAKALGVSESWLIGKSDSIAMPLPNTIDNIFPIEVKRFPILGEIACGEPIFAREDHESYITASGNIHADFCLVAKGDSMTGARICDGDVVFIKKQPIVDNGDIAAVIIGDEATLKRWYYYPEKKKLVLSAENSNYEPFVFIGEELEGVRCLGKAVCFMSNL
ncbi:MAG: S24 family peptidase [Clostridia bacterium]|nr:S24 family peptidase [Clostridia bacterium]